MTETMTPLPGDFEPPDRLLTAADLALLPDELADGPVRYELDDGRLIIMSPPGDEHGAYESNLASELKHQAERRGLGKVRSGSAVIFRKKPDQVYAPDALFVSNAKLPLRRSTEGYLENIPDIVVEVRSKIDRSGRVRRKIGQYLRAGVREVWMVEPATRTVVIHRGEAAPQTLTESDSLATDIIPGFSMPVADVFRE